MCSVNAGCLKTNIKHSNFWNPCLSGLYLQIGCLLDISGGRRFLGAHYCLLLLYTTNIRVMTLEPCLFFLILWYSLGEKICGWSYSSSSDKTYKFRKYGPQSGHSAISARLSKEDESMNISVDNGDASLDETSGGGRSTNSHSQFFLHL